MPTTQIALEIDDTGMISFQSVSSPILGDVTTAMLFAAAGQTWIGAVVRTLTAASQGK
jgi:hypothetical protein